MASILELLQQRSNRLAVAMGLVSIVLFIAGAIMLAVGLTKYKEAASIVKPGAALENVYPTGGDKVSVMVT